MALVMLVDDNDLVRDVLEEFLDEEGHQVLLVADGQQAISDYRTYRPDLVVTDLLMPGISGIEIIQQLRREAPTLPILVISGGGATGGNLLQQAAEAGASATLTKPFAIKKFMDVLCELLDAG